MRRRGMSAGRLETSFAVFEARVRALLADEPEMPATVLAERVGWTGSITWFRENVKRLRPDYRRMDPADRLVWEPGDAAQCDLWFPPRRIPLEDGTARLLPVLVITAAHSRFMLGRMIPTRKTEDLLLGSWELLPAAGSGAAPADLGQRVRASVGATAARRGSPAFIGTLATRLVLLPPRTRSPRGSWSGATAGSRPRSCPAGRSPRPADFNAQFTDWLAEANTRVVRTIKAKPVDLLDGGPGRDAGAAAGAAAPGLAQPDPAGPGLLRAPGHQRLLGRPHRDRAAGRRDRGPGPGPGPRSRAGSWPTSPGLGPRDDDHRPRHKRSGSRAACAVPSATPGAAAEDLTRDLGDYDRAFGLTEVI